MRTYRWRRSKLTGARHLFEVGDDTSLCGKTSELVTTECAPEKNDNVCRQCAGIHWSTKPVSYKDEFKTIHEVHAGNRP